MRGTFTRNKKGYGFIRRENAREDEADWYVGRGYGKGAMTGDTVEFRCLFESRSGDVKEAEVTAVASRAVSRVVGELTRVNGGFIVVGDKRTGSVGVSADDTMDAREGHKVVCGITKYPSTDAAKPTGKITKIIGHINDPGADILSIVERYEIPYEFPAEVWAQTRTVNDALSPGDLEGRRDLRGLFTITIDGEDAKDLDDAITLEDIQGGGFRLYVHIADVAHYVTYGSPLFKEAENRGTSCYLADRVIPMLPHKLSNGICSLNPNADRLALTCVMDIDETGTVASSDVFESVIRSDRRMTYNQVYEMITDGNSPLRSLYGDAAGLIDAGERLRQILHDNRARRGAIDFDTKECKIEVDEDGKAVDISPRVTDKATNLIEEFMILANETVSRKFTEAKLPFVYRTHENPNEDKILSLASFLGRFNIKIRVKHFSKDAQKALRDSKGKPEETLVNRLILRSLKQARYTHELIGHFGLALRYYSHFTSPIRRFPDLVAHTIIKSYLRGDGGFAGDARFLARLPEYCAKASMTERRAEMCERETEAMKKAEYMVDKIGWVFDGVVSGITDGGFFVELPNTVEGMVSRPSLYGDQFFFDREQFVFKGRHTGKEFRLGTKVKISVKSVNKWEGQINFELIDKTLSKSAAERRRGRGFGENQKRGKGGKKKTR